jgi:hypothetical protein
MASILQVATIKDQGGNANAIEIANSSANVTINNLTSSTGFPTGHILQTKHGTLAGTKSTSSASYQDVIVLSITTTVASSKILAIAQTNGSMNGDNAHIHYRIYNVTTSTNVGVGDDAGNRQGTGGLINNTTTGQMDHLTIVGQDSPAQNAGTTLQYKLLYKSNGSTTVYINRSHRDYDGTTYDGRGFSSLTLMEIAP